MGTPSEFTFCGDDCPVEKVKFYAALAFANALSTEEGLETCYTFTPASCEESSDWRDGSANSCTSASFNGLECTGYRLPTESEWEYAYRAGTTTAYYSGTDLVTGSSYNRALDLIGWYRWTTYTGYDGHPDCSSRFGCATHPVGQKSPNSWGLHDMAGNMAEWTIDKYGSYPETTTDYINSPNGNDRSRVTRGGSWNSLAEEARAANRMDPLNVAGLRLARTIP